MLGWILYKDAANNKPESYEIKKFQEVSANHGIQLKVITPEQVDIIVTGDTRKSVLVDDVQTPLPDFILPRMGAGTTYFALAVIRHLERLGVYSFNSSLSIDTVKDKLYHLQILAESGLPIPKTMLVKFPVDVNVVEKNIGFPAVIKTLSGSQGSGVFLIDDKSSLEDLMLLIESTNKNANIIIQEFIKNSKGRDLRVLTIGGRVIAGMERKAKEGSFKANYSRGGSVTQFEITPEIEWLVLEISRILNLDIAGIDLLFDDNGFKICEVNSSPGFEGMEKACKIDIASEIFKFIKIRLGNFK